MGEAKRRRESDPSFGKAKKESWLDRAKASFDKISNFELILWVIIIVSSITTAIWAFTAR